MRAFNFTEEQINRIKEVCETNEISLSELAREMNLPSRSPIKTVIKNLGLKKSQTRSPMMGVKIEWTELMITELEEGYASNMLTVDEIANNLGISEDSTVKKAKELGLKKVRKLKYTDHLIEIIRLYSEEDLTRKEIGERLSLSPTSVRKALESVDITSGYTRIQDLDQKEQFFKDLGNPRYSAPDLAQKYGLSDAAIHQWRKRIYGEFKLQLNTTQRLSELEKEIANLLEEMDVLYAPQKKIDQWSIDFYLGLKRIIEVDGYYHDRNDVKEKDARKVEDLESKGYEVLVIHHKEMRDMKTVKAKIIRKFGLPAIVR